MADPKERTSSAQDIAVPDGLGYRDMNPHAAGGVGRSMVLESGPVEHAVMPGDPHPHPNDFLASRQSENLIRGGLEPPERKPLTIVGAGDSRPDSHPESMAPMTSQGQSSEAIAGPELAQAQLVSEPAQPPAEVVEPRGEVDIDAGQHAKSPSPNTLAPDQEAPVQTATAPQVGHSPDDAGFALRIAELKGQEKPPLPKAA